MKNFLNFLEIIVLSILFLVLGTSKVKAQVQIEMQKTFETRIENLEKDSARLSQLYSIVKGERDELVYLKVSLEKDTIRLAKALDDLKSFTKEMEKSVKINQNIRDSLRILRKEYGTLIVENEALRTKEVQNKESISALVKANVQNESSLNQLKEEIVILTSKKTELEVINKKLSTELMLCQEEQTKFRQKIATFEKIKAENALLKKQQIDELFQQAVNYQKQLVFSDELLATGNFKTTTNQYLQKIDSFKVYFNHSLLDSSKSILNNVNDVVTTLVNAKGVLSVHYNKQDVDAITLELRKLKTDQFNVQSVNYINGLKNDINRYCFMHKEAIAVLELISDSLYSPNAKVENLRESRAKMIRYKYLASELDKKIKDLRYQCKIKAVDGCR
jgi:hypothetical protein